MIPTATDQLLGTDKLSVGPSVGVFRQSRPWTVGLTCSHIWSVAGSSSAASINASRLAPILGYTTERSATYSLGAEFAFDWTKHLRSGPLEIRVSQLTLFADRPIQWGLGFQYYAFSETNAPEWGAMLAISFPIESPRWGSEL